MTAYTMEESQALAAICGIENDIRRDRVMAKKAFNAQQYEECCKDIALMEVTQSFILRAHPALLERWLMRVKVATEASQ